MTTLSLCFAVVAPAWAAPLAIPKPPSATVPALAGPLVAAHRGGFFGASNTLRQFASTMDSRSADILEMDLQSSRDGVVMVFHDPDLGRQTNCKGNIGALPYAALRACLHDGQPLPLFEDVLAATRQRIVVDAEFKTDAVIAPAIRDVIAHDDLAGVYFQVENDRRKYAEARRISTDAYLQYKAESDEDLAWALSLHDPRLVIIEMDRDFVSPRRILAAHQAGKLVSENSWRYEYTEERFGASCTQVFSLGVDIAVTNNPAKCYLQRNAPAYGLLHQWTYDLLGRQHVRRVLRAGLSRLELHRTPAVPVAAGAGTSATLR